MTTRHLRLCLVLPLLTGCFLSLTGCDSAPKATREPDRPRGRYVIVHVPARGLGTAQTIELDTATGKTWRLVSTGASDVGDVTGWLPIDDLTEDTWRFINSPPPEPQADGGNRP